MAKTLRDWVGSQGRLLRLRTQNRASAYPDEDLIFTGRVTATEVKDVRPVADPVRDECEIRTQHAQFFKLHAAAPCFNCPPSISFCMRAK